MNYLAHAYLSFGEPQVLAGNMISDFVKGKKKEEYSPGIQKGIALHRAIDQFTDTHEATQKAKKYFSPAYRLYSGAFVDIVYDHFLATDEALFTVATLKTFAADTYGKLEPQLSQLPEKFRHMFPYMQMQNWLYHYRQETGIKNSFHGLVRRALYMEEGDTAFAIFKEQYQGLKSCYDEFFPALEQFSKMEFEKLMNSGG